MVDVQNIMMRNAKSGARKRPHTGRSGNYIDAINSVVR
jgi:hypothetical protein